MRLVDDVTITFLGKHILTKEDMQKRVEGVSKRYWTERVLGAGRCDRDALEDALDVLDVGNWDTDTIEHLLETKIALPEFTIDKKLQEGETYYVVLDVKEERFKNTPPKGGSTCTTF